VLGNRYKTYSYGCVVTQGGTVVPVTERCYPVSVVNGVFQAELTLTPDDIDHFNGWLEDPQLRYNGKRSWGLWLENGSQSYPDPWAPLGFGRRTCDEETGEYRASGQLQFRVF